MGHLPPAQGPEAVVGREGVVLAGGLTPDGRGQVAAEEWKATTDSGSVPEGAKIRVTKLDGLVLTVEPLDTAHAAPATPRRPKSSSRNEIEEGPPDGLHRSFSRRPSCWCW